MPDIPNCAVPICDLKLTFTDVCIRSVKTANVGVLEDIFSLVFFVLFFYGTYNKIRRHARGHLHSYWTIVFFAVCLFVDITVLEYFEPGNNLAIFLSVATLD